jgi:hypothetical protein
LWRRAKAIPSLDLRFAENKSLVDATTGQNLVTFTRASSGTYVDSQGVIQRATTNLLLRSEEFNDASWTKQSSVSVSANTVIAPNGTLTADTVTADSGLGIFQTITSVIGVNYSNSIYVKAGTATSIMFRDDTGAGRHIVFNPSTGVITSTSGTFVSFGSQAVGDGWYRYWIVYAADTTSVRGIVRPNSAGSAQTFAVWGAQLEQSSTVGEYIPTTSTINSAPRFHHDPTTGESLGLLVEEQRTNLLLYSECNSNWTTAGFGTATYNLGLSALGVFSGVSVGSLGQVWHTLYRAGINLTASTVYAFTLFYRAGTSGRCRLVFRNNTTATETIINGAAGSLSVNGALAGSATVLSQYLCSDGLTYVVTGTFTPNGTSADHWFRIGPDSATSGQTVIALGGQLEAGAFPTSYIPTTTATVTRSADVASITGSNFSSWYRQDEGTVFTDCTINYTVPGTSFPVAASFNDGTSNNRIQNGFLTSSLAGFEVSTGGATQVGIYPNASNVLTRRLATGFRANDFAVSVNGGAINIDTSGTVPTVDRLRFGDKTGSPTNNLFGTIRRLTYWPQRLSNTTLQQITQ